MKRIAFILDSFELQSPGQQLLDRFLIGFWDEGVFTQSNAPVVASVANGDSELLKQRARDFALELAASPEAALENADAVMVASANAAEWVRRMPPGAACYIDALFLRGESELQAAEEAARSRRVLLNAGTAAEFLIQLPAVPKFEARRVTRALVVTHGKTPAAEIEALYALDSAAGLSRRRAEVFSAHGLSGDALWKAAYSPAWKPLLAAAVSRSNTIQGDPERDGRTQDITGLRLIEKLAPAARAWHLEQKGGPALFLLFADGALADMNYAVSAPDEIHSAQLYRPPAPQQAHFDAQARAIAAFFNGGKTDLTRAKFVTEIVRRIT